MPCVLTRSTSPSVSVNDYVKVSNIVHYTKQELAKVKDPLVRLAP